MTNKKFFKSGKKYKYVGKAILATPHGIVTRGLTLDGSMWRKVLLYDFEQPERLPKLFKQVKK